MLRVAVRCEDGDLVPAILEADCGIDDQALRPANAQVGVEEDDVLLLFRHRVFKEREGEGDGHYVLRCTRSSGLRVTFPLWGWCQGGRDG